MAGVLSSRSRGAKASLSLHRTSENRVGKSAADTDSPTSARMEPEE
jgi:hypothetical protein